MSIIIPVRDEPNLQDFLLRLHEAISNVQEDCEVLIMTSDKETLFTPIPSFPKLKVFKSYGDSLERAILLGFSVAKGDKIIVMDADGSHPPEFVPTMIESLNEHDLVVGSRFLPQSKFEYPFYRLIISKFYTKYAQFFGSNLSDPMSGFFAIKRDLVKNIKFKPFTWKIALEIELKSSTNATEVPITFHKRVGGVSKAKIRTGLKLLWDIFWERI